MLYLTCTTISSVDLARYRVSRAKDWVSVDCGTSDILIELTVFINFCTEISNKFCDLLCLSIYLYKSTRELFL